MISKKIRQRNRINVLLHLGKLKGYRDKEDWSQGPRLVYKNIVLITDVIIILIFFKNPGELEGEEVRKAVDKPGHSKP